MLFNSYIFVFCFLPFSLIIYFFLNHLKLIYLSKIFLIIASLFFYSYWNINYLPLILFSIFFNYFISFFVLDNKNFYSTNSNKRKRFLLIGILINLLILAYFKYMNFFIENVNNLFNLKIENLNIILPLAISFFTLQQITFLIDSYESLIKNRKFIDYMFFVTFFPQLISGPIIHFNKITPQFNNLRKKFFNYKNFILGIFIFTVGLFKKTTLADKLALGANHGFDVLENPNLIESWVASYSYTFQLYFDFSGYIDMAIGIALLFNISLPINFNSPYKSQGMIEFWKCWHITLSNFINTYVYVPLYKLLQKPSFSKTLILIIISFLISGLWHGSSWMFVIFGFLNGIGVATNHYWKKKIKKKFNIRFNKYVAWFITFNYLNITFVFFRANELDDAYKILIGLISFNSIKNINIVDLLINFKFEIALILISFFIVLNFKNSNQLIKEFKSNYYYLLITFLLFIISLFNLNSYREFIYFNF